jgi:hypothetical protein
LAAGVLLAYGIVLAMFGLFRLHARQVAVESARRVGTRAQIVRG